MTPDDGVYRDIPFGEYQNWKAINATSVKAGAKSMLHMKAVMDGDGQRDTAALSMGRMIHDKVLEPDKPTPYEVYDGRRAGKAYDEWKELNKGKVAVKQGEAEIVSRVAASVAENPESRLILSESAREVSIVWSDSRYGLAKARLDLLAATFFADLKTTSTIDIRQFQSQFWSKYRYDLQLGWYYEGLQQLAQGKTGLTAYIISAETQSPFDVAIYQADRDVLEIGRIEAVEIATRYHGCCGIGMYPGVARDLILPLQVPDWKKPDWSPND